MLLHCVPVSHWKPCYFHCLLSTKDARQSTEGATHYGKLISRGARDQELDGDTRHRDSDLDRFGACDRRNTLRPVSLLYCIKYEMHVDALG